MFRRNRGQYLKLLWNGHPFWALLNGNKAHLISGNPIDGFKKIGREVDPELFSYLPPVEIPGKIICIACNYWSKKVGIEEMPDSPGLYLKAPTALNGHRHPLIIPSDVHRPEYDPAMAIVIGRTGKNIKRSRAKNYILGYCCANEFTAQDILEQEKLFTRAKSYDTFAPLGPVLKTDFDYKGRKICTRVNGEIRHEGNTDQIVYNPEMLVEFISGIMTLEPWDIILTGIPGNTGAIDIGDSVEVDIEGLGRLETPVVSKKK